jgi:acetoin utilization deacetylase AcuC-like enzyme
VHKLYYSPTYCSASYAFDTTRKAAWIADFLHSSPVEGVSVVEPQPLSVETVCETHSEEYVRAIETGEPWSIASSQGLRWCQSMLSATLASNGGVVAAVRSALEDGVAGSLSSGLHHARRNHGLGFCTFNGLVIAAREALKLGCEKVLILDLDAHGGGGTASLISDEVRIRHLDLVVDPFDVHRGSLNLSSMHSDEYLRILSETLLCIRPDIVIYNAGMDIVEEDCGPPGRGYTSEFVNKRERTVFEWASIRSIPIAYVMAGGYSSRSRTRGQLVADHLSTIKAASEAACQAV